MLKNKKELIYKSWEKLFWKFWVKKVSIDMIVKEAWIAKWTFYLYYKNKEELYESIMDDILECWKLYMDNLAKTVPNVKERFYLHMIWSIWYFNQNIIVKNLINGNTDYYIWKINHDYLSLKHIWFMRILLWNEFSDEKFIEFVANVKWFFSNVINYKICFNNDNEFQNFIMDYAAVIVNWLFSDYKSIKGETTFNEIVDKVTKIKK